jgi:hypothetical protein
MPFYLGIVHLVPWHPDHRLIVPVMPFLFFYGWIGLMTVGVAASWLMRKHFGWLLLPAIPVVAVFVYRATDSPQWRYVPVKLLFAGLALPAALAVTALLVSHERRAEITTRRWQLGTNILAGLLFLIGTLQISLAERYSIAATRRWREHPQYMTHLSWLDAAQFLQKNAGEDTKIASIKSSQFQRLTGLRCDGYPKTRSSEAMLEYLRDFDLVLDVGHVCDIDYLRPALQSAEGMFAPCAVYPAEEGQATSARNTTARDGPKVAIYRRQHGSGNDAHNGMTAP